MKEFLIHSSGCNSFEIDMISNAKIEGLLIPKSVESSQNNQYVFTYEEPINNKVLGDLLNDHYFDYNQFHMLLSQIIKLKIRLDTYMLNSDNIHFNLNEIWFDSVSNNYRFIYFPGTKKDPHQELNFYRHIFLESPQLFDNNSKLVLELRQSSFDLDRFCAFFQKQGTKKKGSVLLRKFLVSKDQPHSTLESKTIQKSRKPCFLDAQNPTLYYEIHFNHNIIGRSDECNIQIEGLSISRKHAVIYKNELNYKLEDLNSSNGTYINGQVINGPMTLVNGDKLQFGDKEFIFIL